MGLACADGEITHVLLPCPSRRAALELLPDGDLRDTSISDKFWSACKLYFATGREAFLDLPVALPSADSFAGKVYRTLQTVPAGETLSYGQLAARIGLPAAARAVAGAMARNPTPLIVPCHRVVGKTSLGGFSAPGGVEAKKKLLALEAKRRVG